MITVSTIICAIVYALISNCALQLMTRKMEMAQNEN